MVNPPGRGVLASAFTCSLALVLMVPFSARAATIHVYAGHSLQAALDSAQPGDEIVVEAGARFVGEFHLPPKPAGPVITVRSSASLPDRRVGPADLPLLPTLASGINAPVVTCNGCANWRLVGLNIEPTRTFLSGEAILIQGGINVTLDRILLVSRGNDIKRGIRGNGTGMTLSRSHVAGIWRDGQDSQAFCAWDGAGPYTVTNNFLEAASENVMFGGANSASPANIPSDILVEGNHFMKPLTWKGLPRTVKNLFELKSAKRVVIRNNLFENNWTDAQAGHAILFTVRNDEGQSPWSVVEDVLFEHNVLRGIQHGFNLLGYDSYQPSGRATRITIRNNLVVASGNFLTVGGELGVLTVDHNTIDQGGSFAVAYMGDVWVAGTRNVRAAAFAVEALTVTNNLARHNDYGFLGDGAGIGTPAISALTRSYSWTNNVLAGELGWGHPYPVITWQPSMAEHLAEFNANYSLTATSTYRGDGTGGTDLGRTSTSAGSTEPEPTEPQPTEPVPTEPPPVPPPVPPSVDTDGPSVTVKPIGKNPRALKYRIDATDPSGISQVQAWFNDALILTATTVPVDIEIAAKSLKPGSYRLVITVTDGIANATTIEQIVNK